jgi:hypothetical protein
VDARTTAPKVTAVLSIQTDNNLLDGTVIVSLDSSIREAGKKAGFIGAGC